MNKITSLLLASLPCFAGCDSDPKHTDHAPDAGSVLVDAAPETDAAPTTTASITITEADGTTPVVGVQVVFSDSTGALLGTVSTDASGRAESDVATDGMVSVVGHNLFKDSNLFGQKRSKTDPEPRDVDRVITFTGVNPGDALTLQNKLSGPYNKTVEVTLDTPIADATQYELQISCDGGTSALTVGETSTLQLSETCFNEDGSLDAFVSAEDTSSKLVGFQYLANQPAANGKTTLSLGNWSTDINSGRVSVANMPPSGNAAFLMGSVAVGTKRYHSMGDLLFSGLPVTAIDYPLLPGGEGLFTPLLFTSNGVAAITAREPLVAGEEIVVDGNEYLPGIAALPEVDFTGTGPKLTWTVDNSVTVDGSYLSAFWGMAPEEDLHTWFVVAGAAETSVAFPELPAQLVQAAPPENAEFVTYERRVDDAAWTGYSDLLKGDTVGYFSTAPAHFPKTRWVDVSPSEGRAAFLLPQE